MGRTRPCLEGDGVLRRGGEATMEWLRDNWFSVLIFILFVAMHFFGHGMHGGHEGHGEEDEHKGHGEGSKRRKGGHGCH